MKHYLSLKHQDSHDDGWARKRANVSMKALKEFLEPVNQRVLVLGCGMGYECEEWKKRGNYVVGCDINKKYLEHAKLKGYADKSFFCDLMVGIKQKDEMFDIVYCSETFEHLFKAQPFISECKRVLKKGGYLILTTDNPCNIKNIMKMLLQKSGYFHTEGHLQYYSPRDMKKLIRDNNFEVLKIRSLGRFHLAFLGDVYLVIARK